MVIDTSALVAVLFDEPPRDALLRSMVAAPRRWVSCATVLETSIVVEAKRGEAAGRDLDLLLHRGGISSVPLDEEQVQVAREAWRRFGKGRHPAGLNFGDLFSYALARSTGDELLFVGEDFARTDVAPVVWDAPPPAP